MPEPYASIAGSFETNDVRGVALILADWASDENPEIKVTDYYLESEDVEIYLQLLEELVDPELLLTCSLPPDPERSLERFNRLAELLHISSYSGFIEHVLFDNNRQYMSDETRRYF